MNGRSVIYRGQAATVVKWDPISAAMCDALIQFEDGSQCWVGSHVLKPSNPALTLPLRKDAIAEANRVMDYQLKAIAARWSKDYSR